MNLRCWPTSAKADLLKRIQERRNAEASRLRQAIWSLTKDEYDIYAFLQLKHVALNIKRRHDTGEAVASAPEKRPLDPELWAMVESLNSRCMELQRSGKLEAIADSLRSKGLLPASMDIFNDQLER